jgi:hypothetical protein
MKKFADTFKGDVIKIDGVCYEFVGYEEAPAPDVTGDIDVFSTCEECEQQSSAMHQQSSAVTSSCPDADPEMVLTVTGSTGTITWCGETWVLPGESGDPKTVCPDIYNKGIYTAVSPGARQHRWQKAGTTANPDFFFSPVVSLSLHRYADAGPFRGNKVELIGLISVISFVNAVPNGYVNPYFNTPPNANGFALPTVGDYDIPPEFFGSITSSNSVTYQWDKGNGWPS